MPDHPAVKDPHAYLRDLHDFATRRRGDAMLLAEANEPLETIAAFFGERGDQMDMLFNFVLNQALYLAFVRHDATPVREALRSLPPIPPQAQWANFIKNHDEASLDKLTDAEREEVYASFAPKTSMRLFDRRHPAPLPVDGRRRPQAPGARLQPDVQPSGDAASCSMARRSGWVTIRASPIAEPSDYRCSGPRKRPAASPRRTRRKPRAGRCAAGRSATRR